MWEEECGASRQLKSRATLPEFGRKGNVIMSDPENTPKEAQVNSNHAYRQKLPTSTPVVY